jgi:HrpA-like RNA helicase
VEELEEVLNDFKNIKPLLDENRTVFEREIAAKSLIREDEEGIEEVEEERELEESMGNLQISSTNEWKCDENEETPVDPITGRRLPVLSPTEIKKRCDQLFRSAQARLVDKIGPVVPHLPIVEKRDAILDLIEKNRVVVLSGDTG